MKEKNIIVACDTLRIGGAETFAMRMARYYKERLHNVCLVAISSEGYDKELVFENAGDIEVFFYKPSKYKNWLIYKTDGLLERFGIFNGLRRRCTISYMQKLLKLRNVDIIHTNMFASIDIFCAAAKNESHIKVIHTVHGDLVNLYYQELTNNLLNISRYDKFCIYNRLPDIVARLNYLVCPAEMHVNIFKQITAIEPTKIKKIYYPFVCSLSLEKKILLQDIGIPNDGFVFGSVARCIKEKGWTELLKAFVELEAQNTYLILVGGGPYLKELRNQYGKYKNIVFLGNQTDPKTYINLFNVGISASYFWESLPFAIIEYLSFSKPIIVTDNAESNHMVEYNGKKAGIIIPLKKDKWGVVAKNDPLDYKEITKSLKFMLKNQELLKEFSDNAADCFTQFNKEKIVLEYECLF